MERPVRMSFYLGPCQHKAEPPAIAEVVETSPVKEAHMKNTMKHTVLEEH